MANTVEVILEFLKKNNFRNAECALRAELSAMKGSASLAIDELPRPPPVKLQLGNDGNFESSRDGNSTTSFDSAIFLSMTNTPEGFFELGSFIDVPAGQDISSSGMKNSCGIPSVSQGMLEDVSDRLSGFATAGDGESAIDYGCQCWDSDTYEDDDDPGYHRQPIENEAWFLAHEIENPTEDELASSIKLENDCNLNEDVRSVMEEESSLFVENELRHAWKERVEPNLDALTVPDGNISSGHEGEFMSSKAPDSLKVMDSWHCLNRDIRAEVGNGQGRFDCPLEVGNSFLGATRSDDLLMNNSGSGEYMAGDSSEGDPREGETETLNSMQGTYWQSSSFQERLGACAISQLQSNDVAGSSVEDDYEEHFGHRSYYNEALFRKSQNLKLQLSEQDLLEQGSALVEMRSSTTNQRCKSEASSTSTSIESKETINIGLFERSNLSSEATNDYLCMETKDEGEMEEDINKERDCEDSVAPEDEEMAAVQDQIQRIGNDEDEYEIFDLKIIHRKNRTGFEEDKDLSVLINSVIAGRYHVSEYLGSAAFSKAVQAHDLHTGMDVCMKIIKNNKDFFDQSLDEIKLLKYVNKNDPADKHHILRLYDYFYHREHLFIVCELLRANLYEFQKFNKESGGEIYFTMPRLQSITRQCLEALEFLHGLGLIHCDLKPENILVKSYSRCEIKVIDLGSSCFQTDHLCSYVQSRSYRAPEVILGLPYDQKIDLWSLGCILAELCSGNVLFQNDSLATLLARMVGILGPMDPEMLAKGRDTHKYFTKNHVLYERIQETDQLEYILPKKTSLSHRLPLGDTGFVEFVGYLLQINPLHRPTAKEALKHPWLSHPYEPISS